ncbi:MAG: hypothetical protein KTR31_35600 [Myxococcales bacterium]|nr:hypothetical protein [Myxococcales bacterium]
MSDPVATDVSDLPSEALHALGRHLARLRHDLGKYVSLQVRWIGADPEPADLREAVSQDLLATRRGPQGVTDAATLWAELRGPLTGGQPLVDGVWVDLSTSREVQAIDHAMVTIARVVGALREGVAQDVDVRAAAEGAVVVSGACRDLATRIRSA